MTTLTFAIIAIGAKRLAVQLGGRRQAVGAGGGKKGEETGDEDVDKGHDRCYSMCDGLGGLKGR